MRKLPENTLKHNLLLLCNQTKSLYFLTVDDCYLKRKNVTIAIARELNRIYRIRIKLEMKIAYLMSRFPKVTETFVVNEIHELLKENIDVGIYPLKQESHSVVQPKAKSLMDRVYYSGVLNGAIIKANLLTLLKQPISYLTTLLSVIKCNISSLNFVVGAIGYFPKAVYLARLMQQHQITHIHAHFVNHPTLVAYIIHQLTGIGYSFTAHGSDLHKRQAMLKEKFESAKFAVMISNYNRDFFYRHTKLEPSDKLHIVRCGFDNDTFLPTVKESHSGPLQILCVASLREVKGHTYLLDAAKVLQERNLDFEMHFIGEGEERSALTEKVNTLQLSKQVFLHGAKTQAEILPFMQQADIFALASFKTKSGNREGIPVVLMEAMAMEVPIVASNVSGIPELVQDTVTGLLAEPQNGNDFAEKIIQTVTDKNATLERVSRAKHLVGNEFSLSNNAQKLIALFKRYA